MNLPISSPNVKTYQPQIKFKTVVEGVIFDPRDSLKEFPDYHIRQDPIYMCDLITPENLFTTIANCYAVDKRSLKHYQDTEHNLRDVGQLTKAHTYVQETENPYGNHPQSILAKAANHIYQQHPKRYIKNKVAKPIFSAIVAKGTDTFSHKQGRIICERTHGHYSVTGGYKNRGHLVPGHLTGVKINLTDSFLPLRKFIPRKDLLHQLVAQSQSIINLYLGY